MFKIGDFSRITHVPASTLRYYADIGLLEPAHIDRFTGYRYYTLEQLPRLNRILALRDLGLPLESIAQMISQPVTAADLETLLRDRERELERALRETGAQLDRVRARLDMIRREEAAPAHEIVLKSVAAQRALTVHEVIPVGAHVAEIMTDMALAAEAHKLPLQGPPLTIFHDPEFREVDLDVEIVFPADLPLGSAFDLREGRVMTVREVEAIPTAASTLHAGSYDLFPETYGALAAWIAANGFRMTGHPREVYLRPPSDALTEVMYPVKRGG